MAVIEVTEITNVSKQVVLVPYNPTDPDLSVTSLTPTASGVVHLQPGVQFSIESSRILDLKPLLSERLITVETRRIRIANIEDRVGDGLIQGLASMSGVADVPSIPQTPGGTTSFAADDFFNTVQDGELTTGNVQQNDTNDSSGILESFVVLPTSDGEVVLFRNGDIRYTPNPGFFGQDTMTYQNRDGDGWTNIATVTIDVFPTGP